MSSSPSLKAALARLGVAMLSRATSGAAASTSSFGATTTTPFAVAATRLHCLNQRRWMAVPKRKVSPSRRGIRNGPKLPRRVDSIARCSAPGCGRIFPLWAAAPPADCKEAACPSKVGTVTAAAADGPGPRTVAAS